MNCNSFQPCITFTDYIANKSIVDNTTFIFLHGTHHLDIPLNLVNLSNVSLLGLGGLQGEMGAVRLLFSSLVNITWTDCDGVEIRCLTFILNGQPQQDFSALAFEGTNGILSNLTLLGNSSMVRGVFLSDSSYIKFSNVFVSGATSSRGPGVYGINSTVDFRGQNSFVDNAATYEGGAIALHDCTLNFGGSISFQNNSAACGGAVFTFGGSQNIFGYTSFVNNTARSELNNTGNSTNISVCMSHTIPSGLGGGMLIYSGNQNITNNISFTNNKAFSGGALWIANSTIHIVSENISFIRNTADFIGGAMSLLKVNHTMSGAVSFLHNSATFKGGAVSVDGGRYDVSGNISFMNNTAESGGAMSIIGGNHSSIGCVSFINNVATNGSGGALLISEGRHNISGNISFVNNSAHLNDLDFRGGGAMSMANGSHCITGYVSFINNSAPHGNGGAMSLSNISSNISGDIFFISNTAMYDGGALVLFRGTSSISGNVSFVDNSVSSRNGGAMSINYGQINIYGNSSLVHNIARYEAGALELYRSAGVISGYSLFVNNFVLYAYGSGGAVEMDTVNGESLNFTGIQKFVGNSAERGGAMAFFGRYKLILTSPLQALFTKNHATDYGGAIYFADDTSARVQCSVPYFSRDDCHMELSSTSNIYLNFSHNTAGSAGTILYGGGLDTCKLYIGGGYRESDGEIIGGSYSNDPPGTIRNISYIISDDNITSDISSNRLKVCVCEGERLECESLHRAVVRGQKLTLLASVVGQNNEFVSNSPVRISLEDDVQINPAQRLQETRKECTPILYRLLSYRSQTSVTLSPDNSVCQGGLRVNVTFLPCPDAFTQSGSECVCDSRLHRYNTTCNVDDSSITRSTNIFWMKPLYDGEIYKGLILHSGCPFDYCVDSQVNITFDDLDAQCNHNHSGMLCGSCKDNFSIALGTLHCLPCSNNYLALLLLFALAGVSLVAVLLLLQLSVANGTINGLIFFANIIQANRSEFFPLGDTNILTVFIAWLNLDLGIETCFYDGMTTYAYAWLQFLFPFYVWFLIVLIIIASRYSSKIAGCLGNNPVAVLSTLVLLSYSKILHNIITGLSLTRLEYPDSNKYCGYMMAMCHTFKELTTLHLEYLLF